MGKKYPRKTWIYVWYDTIGALLAKFGLIADATWSFYIGTRRSTRNKIPCFHMFTTDLKNKGWFLCALGVKIQSGFFFQMLFNLYWGTVSIKKQVVHYAQCCSSFGRPCGLEVVYCWHTDSSIYAKIQWHVVCHVVVQNYVRVIVESKVVLPAAWICKWFHSDLALGKVVFSRLRETTYLSHTVTKL